MKIRYGTYTLYENIEMSISEYYGHGLEQDLENRILSYPRKYGQLEGFSLDVKSDMFKKDVLVKDLKNAFSVITKAKYRGEIFEIEPYYGDETFLHLRTKDLELGKELCFYELHDGYGKPYYLGEIKLSEIEKIWEERSLSKYDLPMPEGVKGYQEI